MGVLDFNVGIPSIDDAEGFRETAVETAEIAIWADNPTTQVAVNAVVIVVAMLSSSVGFLPGLVIAFAALGLIWVGIARVVYQFVAGRS